MAKTTDQITRAFQQLLAARKKLAARITTKEETAQTAKEQQVVSAASALTVERIVKDLADLQLAYDRDTEALANTLLAETSKLTQVQQAIEVETRHLQELADIELAANALDILAQTQQAEENAFEERSAQQRDSLTQQIATQRDAWQKEQAAHEQQVAEYEAALLQERSQAEANFQYDLERKRTIELDKFETKKRTQEREMTEMERVKSQDWTERERAMAERQEQLEDYRAQAEGLSQKLAGAIETAREQAMQAAAQDAQVKSDLYRKEIQANQQVRELKIQSLNETIARQAEQLDALSAELKDALKQMQALASQAIGGTAGSEPSASD
jgi:hypothetical protein